MKDQLIDGYRLVRLIGAGGFGEVWLCESMVMPGLWKALKWIPAYYSRRLERELEALVQYQRAVQKRASAHLMRIEHVNRTAEGLFYVMPLADGMEDETPEAETWHPATLSNLIHKQKSAGRWFTSQEISLIMCGVLSGLQDLSDLGLVHRDLKPENIIFLNRTPVITDISLVGQDREEQTQRGTPGFIAPTWYLEGGGHPDQYASGALLFTLMTGQHPDKMGRAAFRWPPGGEKSLSREERAEWLRLHKIVYRATHETPSERFREFAAMRFSLSPPEFRPVRRRAVAYTTLTLVGITMAWGALIKPPLTNPKDVIQNHPNIDTPSVNELFDKAMSYYAGNDAAGHAQPVDLGFAARMFAAGANQGNAKCQNMFGFLHVFRNDAFEPESAFPWFQKAADQGDAVGQFNLACCYYWGVGTPRDDVTATHWFRRSAQQGFPAAQAALAFVLYSAAPPVEDLTESIDLLKKASAAGRVEAMNILSVALENGDGVDKDITTAEMLREKVNSLRSSTEDSHLAVWTDQNGKTAWRGANYIMTKRLAAQVKALYEFSNVDVTCTETGTGPVYKIRSTNPKLTEQRILQAIETNFEAAKMRNTDAALWVGRAYLEGRFLPRSKKNALPWLRRAVEREHEIASKLIKEAISEP